MTTIGYRSAPELADGDAVAWLRYPAGTEASRPLRLLRAAEVVAAVPWRRVRSARGQAHYPGWYWSATTGGHVVYESRLELARLLVADFDPGVAAIAAQPFMLRAQAGGRVRRHVPDFLLADAGGRVRVVNVKPAQQAADPRVAEALAWPGRLIGQRGWEYEIWTGDDPVYLANLRFLAGYRRPWLVSGTLLEGVLAAARPGDTIAAVKHRLAARWPAGQVTAAVARLLWEHRLTADLRHRLDGDSVLEAAS